MSTLTDNKSAQQRQEGLPDGRQEANVSAETLARLRAGDHSAFEEVFFAYFEKVKYFISALTKSPDVAEELAQEIFVNLWEHRDKINPDKNFNAYIYTIARNGVYNYAKSRTVRDRYVQSVSDEDSPADAEEIIVAKETELLIEIAVSRMPKQRRRIFELSRNNGLSNEDIARELGITRNAVDKQLRLALSDVRNVIAVFTAAVLLFFK